MGFVRMSYMPYIGVDDAAYSHLPLGSVIDVAFTSSFVDRYGKWYYVPDCNHSTVAPEIIALHLPELIPAHHDDAADCEHWDSWTDECICHHYLRAVSTLENRGWIHLSVVDSGDGFELNLYTHMTPTQAQLGTLWDFYMACPEESRPQVETILNRWLENNGMTAMFGVALEEEY